MTSSFTITEPQSGEVTLTLSWDEAEVLTRLVGLANSGYLKTCAPTLAEFVEQMVTHVGRSTSTEARKYLAFISRNDQQIYLEDV